MLTPLEWAMEHGHTDLVNMSLNSDTDASHTVERKHGHGHGAVLAKVVREDRHLLESLAGRANRVSSTMALGNAVELQDKARIEILYVDGVCWD
ncbi:hypothetical protein NPX13_g2932 [Xylaria arbuscula]|uniref:Uncharacterized protein n=1 Tax=Xylaria arbuscula TaxID=114810 RepID=A0A9W8NJJ0_9PEZI|nr:hypothetical protein NPX13_g2932 [Xylaria arbuscula]